MPSDERVFSPRFLSMCGFTFTVFLSAFQLLPVAPYRILALGGTAAVAGLTGVGTGSIAMGWIIEHFGFQQAWTTAAVLAACAIPFFLVIERRVLKPALDTA